MTARAQSRKHRGYATQRLLATRWREREWGRHTKAIGAGEQGNDLMDVVGLKTEIKARDAVSLVAALRQAGRAPGEGMPLVVWRHNGQGESTMDEWTVTLFLVDFERLYDEFQGKRRE